jgi:hypothetical protein
MPRERGSRRRARPGHGPAARRRPGISIPALGRGFHRAAGVADCAPYGRVGGPRTSPRGTRSWSAGWSTSPRNGKFYALNATTGAKRWKSLLPGYAISSPVVAEGVATPARISRMSVTSMPSTRPPGARLWDFQDSNGAVDASPAVAPGVVYVHALNAATERPAVGLHYRKPDLGGSGEREGLSRSRQRLRLRVRPARRVAAATLVAGASVDRPGNMARTASEGTTSNMRTQWSRPLPGSGFPGRNPGPAPGGYVP